MIAWFMLAASAATPVSDSAEADAAVAASSPVIERRLPDFDPGRTGFTVTAGPDLEIGYSEFTLFVHPGERLDLVANTPVRWHEGEAAETQDAVLAFDWLGFGGSSRPRCRSAPRLPVLSIRCSSMPPP